MRDTILVTGGAGFVGSAVVRHLIAATTSSVVNVDALTHAGNFDSIAAAVGSPRHFFERIDIRDTAALRRLFAAYLPRAVIHLAAESYVDPAPDAPATFIETNVVGTYNLLQAAREYWAGLPPEDQASFRFLHVSTYEAYGHIDDTDSALPAGTHPPAPASPHAASKAAADLLARACHETYGLPVIIAISSDNYGPYQFPDAFIPRAILAALDGETISVDGGGLAIRDWLYVEDHVRALLTVLTGGQVGGTYEVGGRCERRNIDVVHQICGLLDELRPRPGGGSYADQVVLLPDRPGDGRRYTLDNSRIETELGWLPGETIESGLRKTITWYLANDEWWGRIRSGAYRGEQLGVAR